MQQTKSYWYLLAAFGVTSACAGAACTVTSSSDDTAAGAAGEDTAGTSSAGTNNAGTGGASAGAAGATAGAAGTVASTGGTGGVDPTTVPMCDVTAGGSSGASDTPTGTPAATCISGVTDACSTCVQQKCCAEYSQCFGTSPGNVCGFGGPNNEGEFPCYQACLQAAFANGGSLDDSDRQTCANSCVTATDAMGALDCGTLGDSTNGLIGCLMDNNCNTVCYGG